MIYFVRCKGATAKESIPTAHAMAGDRERFVSASKADEYMTKPLNLHHFVDTVLRLTTKTGSPLLEHRDEGT
jgi:hypothetical protein